MADAQLQSRVQSKIDTLENWTGSSLKIKEGEICFATVAADASKGIDEPIIMLKIGTADELTFNQLPWSFHAKASDVLECCKSSTDLTAFVNALVDAAKKDYYKKTEVDALVSWGDF